MSLRRCSICGNQYHGEEWDLCPFCHGRTDWRVYVVPTIRFKDDPRIEGTYHLYSERTFVGIYVDAGCCEWWIPVTGTAFKYYRDKTVDHSHPLFSARWAVMRAKQENDFIKDERFV